MRAMMYPTTIAARLDWMKEERKKAREMREWPQPKRKRNMVKGSVCVKKRRRMSIAKSQKHVLMIVYSTKLNK